MEDEEIVMLFVVRSEQAIAKSADRYGAYCHSIAMRILCDEDDAAECVNDVYLKAWNAIPPHKPSCLRTFLGKLTRNTAFDRCKRRGAVKRGGGELPLVLEELEECLAAGQGADETADAVLLKDAVNRFLSTLNETERAIFLRRYWRADTVGEIASLYDMSENHVNVVLHRVRKKLKRFLDKET